MYSSHQLLYKKGEERRGGEGRWGEARGGKDNRGEDKRGQDWQEVGRGRKTKYGKMRQGAEKRSRGKEKAWERRADRAEEREGKKHTFLICLAIYSTYSLLHQIH